MKMNTNSVVLSMLRGAAFAVTALAATACIDTGAPSTDAGLAADAGPATTTPDDAAKDAITYRDLASHPGCSTDGLSYTAASIPGYTCAAKAYTPASPDATKPIVLLIHGNSDTPSSWESHENAACDPAGATQGDDMLAEKLMAAGYETYAIDMRYDLVDDPAGNNDTENLAKNMDHGWGTPIAQHFIKSVLDANPDRKVSIIGFSFGVTTARDALRRLYVEDGETVFSRVQDMVMLAGANHGVSSGPLCGVNLTMRGQVTCEMGDRAAYSPTDFMRALNGDGGAWETPCSDGTSAFGGTGACDGNSVDYTTIVMQDIEAGTQQDLFVSEASSRLEGADNQTIGLNDVDESDYFFCGLFKNHYGAARSAAAMTIIMDRLGD